MAIRSNNANVLKVFSEDSIYLQDFISSKRCFVFVVLHKITLLNEYCTVFIRLNLLYAAVILKFCKLMLDEAIIL